MSVRPNRPDGIESVLQNTEVGWWEAWVEAGRRLRTGSYMDPAIGCKPGALHLPACPHPMIRSELIARIAAENPHLRARDAEAVVDTILDRMAEALASGGRVELRGFGTFSVKDRPPRQGRNPRTGKSVAVPEKRVLAFSPGKDMRERLNPRQPEEPDQIVDRMLKAS